MNFSIISLPVKSEREKRKAGAMESSGERGNLPKQLRRALITILNKI